MRRVGLAVVVAMMVALSGCGRQVTGLNAPNGGIVPAGQMLIRFETAAQPDYANLRYLIVFNTQNTNEPYALGYNASNYQNYSMFFLVGGGSNFVSSPQLNQVYQDPSSGTVRAFQITYPTNSVTFNPQINSANSAFGFEITFNRCIFDRPTPSANPPPATQCPPYTNLATQWAINLFTVDNSGSVIDSLGPFGANDTSFTFSVDTGTVINDRTYFKPATNTTLQNRSAAITGIEVFNTP
jgi:hypothetical protein